MRVAHFDCFSGISGDMVLGAVIDAGVPADAIRAALDSLGLPISLEVEKVKRCGFAATKATVTAADQEDYRFLPDVEAILAKGDLTEKQRGLAAAIFRKVAVAEATAHGMPLERVHFHEVGALDSIADIVGAAVGLDLLGVEKFTSSPVPTGSGTVKCAHGIMPVPTPGTAELLKGVPLAPSVIKTELTTPTGAAILTAVVSEFTAAPVLTIERIGHGSGTKDFIEQPNLLRLMVGTAAPAPHPAEETDTVAVLETNLDDISPEVIGFAIERLFEAGALDVFAVPVQMKKQRPGVLLSVICDPVHVAAFEEILFRETGTFGVRRTSAARAKLRREAVSVETPWGPVDAKRGWRDGFEIVTPEYEDCVRVAREHNVPLRDVYAAVRK
ncbi:nickel pincer cofactor biosynthesis protein LarC [Gemmata sp. JC717]|uniref:nickel pincer cofactor biosynthesis protein LarC n=1 Tax=Gemmata algarum TaxID=2975278 RepID=UPI0021BB1DB1|nr:nickel pincer cofactor biosynthesis protein LarC [Gemmata algarum]MDY3553996.1 nickel pincer cofactor biosynthesis protein LarC [Gemmata algarum]